MSLNSLAEFYLRLCRESQKVNDDEQGDYYWDLCMEYHNQSLTINRPHDDISQEPF